MDKGTVYGLVAGLVLVFGTIFLSPGASFFFNLPAFLIVFGGTLAATFMAYSVGDMKNAIAVLKNAFNEDVEPITDMIDFWYGLARKARKDGLLALEEDIYATTDSFIRKGIQFMVDGIKKEIIHDLLSIELSNIAERHETGIKMMKDMGSFAPAFGLIGTLIGLIQMLQNMSDPSQLGAGMATALVTTFYGTVFANLIFIPLASKLEKRSSDEAQVKQLVINAIWSIQSGDNPSLLSDKLMSVLSPSKRTDLGGGEGIG